VAGLQPRPDVPDLGGRGGEVAQGAGACQLCGVTFGPGDAGAVEAGGALAPRDRLGGSVRKVGRDLG
jgi:hypothetical protein